MKRVKYGIIGLGFFGEKHAEVLSSMPGVELTAVCTRRPGRLEEIARRFAVPKRYESYRDLLADSEIEAVSVVTHVNDHRDIAMEALRSGKHVFLEKPMAGIVSDCDAIIAAAKVARGKFMVGHICRFDPRVSLAKEAVKAGRIGKITSMHAARNLPAKTGAGVLDKISALMGDGIHDTDLMLWFTGSRVKTVYAQTLQSRSFKNADIGWAMYRFESGAIGVVETIWCLPDTTPFAIDARMEIVGTEGAIYINCGEAGLTINDSAGVQKPDTVYWPEVLGRRVGVLRNELDYFVGCICCDKTPDVITPEESREAVAVMCAAEKSAARGEVIQLDRSVKI